jgi:hypothetical protein
MFAGAIRLENAGSLRWPFGLNYDCFVPLSIATEADPVYPALADP